jgi:hypothetical protein
MSKTEKKGVYIQRNSKPRWQPWRRKGTVSRARSFVLTIYFILLSYSREGG